MKTVLVSLNAKYVHAAPAAFLLCAEVERIGMECEVIESTVNEPLDEVLERIIRMEADVVGFCCYIWNISRVLELAECLKKLYPREIVILGGPEAGLRAKEILRDISTVDYVIEGEGEKALPRLLNELGNGNSPQRHIFGGSGQTPKPLPQRYLDRLEGRIAYFETSRGCPFRCAFCLSGSAGERVRTMPVEEAKTEISRLFHAGVQTVKFVDRTFNADGTRARELMEHCIRHCAGGTRFHFEIGADLLCEKDFALLAEAPSGLFQFEAGIQSLNEEVLANVHRKTDTQRLMGNLKKLLALGTVHLHVDLIAGLPGEGLESFRQSFDRVFALRPHMLQLGFLKLLHGSELRRRAEELGICYREEPPYEVLETRELSYLELRKIKRAEDMLERLYNSGKFLCTVEAGLTAVCSPFELFAQLGEELAGPKTNQFKFAEQICEKLIFFGVEPSMVKDAMREDFVATDPCVRLPNFLKTPGAPPLSAVRTDGTVFCANTTLRDLRGRYKIIEEKPLVKC